MITTAFTAIPEKMTISTSRFFGGNMTGSLSFPNSSFAETYRDGGHWSIDLNQTRLINRGME